MMNRLQVLDCGGAAEIEEVLSDAEVASTVAFPRGDVREGVLDGDALSEDGAPRRSLLEFSELLLLGLVMRDRYSTTPSGGGLRALGALRTRSACLRVELDSMARFEGFDFASGARNRLGMEVEFEVELAEQSRTAGALGPGLREHLSAGLKHFADDRAVHVRSVDVQFGDAKPLALDVLLNWGSAFLFGTIRRGHRAREDRMQRQVTCDMFLVAIEAFRLTLPTVPHLRILDRDTPVGSNA